MAEKSFGKAASGPTDVMTRTDVLALKSSFRNRLIDGGFTVNQRGYASGASLAAGAYAHDRWKAGTAGAYTFTQAYPTTTVTITSGTLQQVIEAAAMEGGAYALSWAGTAQARVTYTAQNASSATTTAYAASPVLLTNLAVGTSATVEFGAGSGSGSVTLGQVQLEPGTAPSAFELRPIGTELTLCQRYYFAGTLVGTGFRTSNDANGLLRAGFALPVPMRASPAITVTANSGFADGENGSQTWPTGWTSTRTFPLGFTGTGGYAAGTNSTVNAPASVGATFQASAEL